MYFSFKQTFFTAVIPLTGLFPAHVCPCTKTERGLTSPYIMFFFVFNDLRTFRFVHIGGIVIVAVLSWCHNNVVLSVSQMSNMTDTINQSYVKTFLSITILPILFQYCYKYCYSDSRNLWVVMKAGGLAL